MWLNLVVGNGYIFVFFNEIKVNKNVYYVFNKYNI